MCSMCGGKTYGQSQPEAIAADRAKLKRILAARENVAINRARRANAEKN